jgi:hypothetical protein
MGSLEDRIYNANFAYEAALRHRDGGDDSTALRIVEKSLRIHPTDAAKELEDWLKTFGEGSEYAKAVERVMAATDHYGVLGLPRYSLAEERDVHKKYLLLSRRLHPDKSKARNAEEAFKRLSEAKRVLEDDDAREKYDEKLQRESQPSAAAPPRAPAPPRAWEPPPAPAAPSAETEALQAEGNRVLESLSLNVLKKLCKRRHLAVSGNKADLHSRLTQMLGPLFYFNPADALRTLREDILSVEAEEAAIAAIKRAEQPGNWSAPHHPAAHGPPYTRAHHHPTTLPPRYHTTHTNAAVDGRGASGAQEQRGGAARGGVCG